MDRLKLKLPIQIEKTVKFVFEVKDNGYAHLGIKPNTFAVVSKNQRFTTRKPVVFKIGNEKIVGKFNKVIEDLYELHTDGKDENPRLFVRSEIKIIGQICGSLQEQGSGQCLTFEKLPK